MHNLVSVRNCPDYTRQQTLSALRKTMDDLGGITSFIRAKDKVLLKPNLLMAVGPEYAITTHPEIVRAIIILLKEAGVEKIYIGDSPSNWGKAQEIRQVYEHTGMSRIAREEKVELVELRANSLRAGLPLAAFLDYVDKVISIPKLKTHELMVLTGAVKNLFGLIPGLYKTELHKKHYPGNRFAKRLVDIYEAVRPALTIVDAIEGLEGEGPGRKGRPRHIGLVIAASDAMAVDIVIARIMGLQAKDVPTLAEGIKRGLAPSGWEDVHILGDDMNGFPCADFKLPQPSLVYRLPPQIFNLIQKQLNYWPKVNRNICNACCCCRKICPAGAISVEKKAKIDLRHCIKCFCCSEACPQGAISTRKSLLARILGLNG